MFLSRPLRTRPQLQGILNYLILHLTEAERLNTRDVPRSIITGTDCIGIATALRGYISKRSMTVYQDAPHSSSTDADAPESAKETHIDHYVFNDDPLEDRAAIDLAALISSRFPAAVLILPASAASLGLGPEWDIKRCMIRAVFGSFGIPVVSPDALHTNIVWAHNGGLCEGYMKLSDDNVTSLVTMLGNAQRLANTLRKPDHHGSQLESRMRRAIILLWSDATKDGYPVLLHLNGGVRLQH